MLFPPWFPLSITACSSENQPINTEQCVSLFAPVQETTKGILFKRTTSRKATSEEFQQRKESLGIVLAFKSSAKVDQYVFLTNTHIVFWGKHDEFSTAEMKSYTLSQSMLKKISIAEYTEDAYSYDAIMPTHRLNIKTAENSKQSVAGRAAAGAVIAGPVGAVVGAASAAEHNREAERLNSQHDAPLIEKKRVYHAAETIPNCLVIECERYANSQERNAGIKGLQKELLAVGPLDEEFSVYANGYRDIEEYNQLLAELLRIKYDLPCEAGLTDAQKEHLEVFREMLNDGDIDEETYQERVEECKQMIH
ncbi:MAG: hypothetical protein ACOX7F_04735 [Eubacteriales bacterium]|jgi:hypothetical protein